jgi:hypothetical protein
MSRGDERRRTGFPERINGVMCADADNAEAVH